MSSTGPAPATGPRPAPVHVSVLLDRVLELLAPACSRDGAVLVDATLGLAGHTLALLEAHPGLRCRRSGAGGRGPEVACVDASGIEGAFTSFTLADGRRVTRVTVARGLAI